MDNIAEYVERYRTFDEPVPFKGLLIYPIKVKDYYKFTSCIDVLKIEKNKIPDVQIIQMSYLTFLLGLIIESEEYRVHFVEVCKLCFKLNQDVNATYDKFTLGQILYHEDEDIGIYFINGYDIKFVTSGNITTLSINGNDLSSKDFDELIDIICYLNFPDYDTVEMSEDFKRVMEEYYALKNRNVKPPTLEEEIIAIMGQTGMSKAQIKEETIYTLQGMVDSIICKVDYIVQHIYRSQAVTDKKLPDIEHWVIKSNKDKYADIFADLEEYKQNFQI